jgi:ribosome maturation factor RimP
VNLQIKYDETMQVSSKGSPFLVTKNIEMDKVKSIERLIEPALGALGYHLVKVMLVGTQRLKLQVMIERIDNNPVSINDCVRASRELSALLDVADPIENSYVLEVSSPGLDRPLTKKEDFVRFAGSKVKVETYDLVEGSRRFKGLLQSANEDEIVLIDESKDQPVKLRYEQIAKAKLQPEF